MHDSAKLAARTLTMERLVGSIRRECLDHMIVFNEDSLPLRRTLSSYFQYYGLSRTHLSLATDAPEARVVRPQGLGLVIEPAEVGGLQPSLRTRAQPDVPARSHPQLQNRNSTTRLEIARASARMGLDSDFTDI